MRELKQANAQLQRELKHKDHALAEAAAFGLLHLTTFTSDSLSLTVLLTLAPYPSDADRKHFSLTGSMPHSRAGYVVPAASYHLVTEIACAGRVRLTEQPVSSLAQAS
ncbi:hypothetical protein [Paraburkholderia humisilvae]|uniref:hypothetical protein n=1 Tax=Paraburkholderia humisilvae TaxID=627669 RepID=UPI0015821AA9|nr:hypothetical protein [Paraburkholderia humisilvae]